MEIPVPLFCSGITSLSSDVQNDENFYQGNWLKYLNLQGTLSFARRIGASCQAGSTSQRTGLKIRDHETNAQKLQQTDIISRQVRFGAVSDFSRFDKRNETCLFSPVPSTMQSWDSRIRTNRILNNLVEKFPLESCVFCSACTLNFALFLEMDIHMFALIFFCFFITTESETIDGVIEENVQYFHTELSVFPSKSATIEFELFYEERSFCPTSDQGCAPKIDVHTTEDELIFKENCTDRRSVGQVFNEDLDISLPPYLQDNENFEYRDTTTCTHSGEAIIHCWGKLMIQDFMPRNLSMSFRFKCSEERNPHKTFQGLKYNISLHSQSNVSECVKIPTTSFHTNCNQFHTYTSLPNMIGVTNTNQFKIYAGVLESFLVLLHADKQKLVQCHAHLEEIMCYLFAPKCDASTKQVTQLCSEMCFDMIEACMSIGHKLFAKIIASQSGDLNKGNHMTEQKIISLAANSSCAYLPSRFDESHTCFYKPVVCSAPPNSVSNTVLSDHHLAANQSENFPAKCTTEYSCASEKFQMRGNSTVTCLFSGKWSDLPECLALASSPLAIVLTILAIPLAVFLSIAFWYLFRKLSGTKLHRNREYDAFVCYHFDTDHNFVVNELLPNLDQFSLHMHSYDFTPGADIYENIENAIEKSNCALIVVSQGFVDSMWGKREFEHCDSENLKDPAFKLLVIMPGQNAAEEIDFSTNKCLKYFVKEKTYLEKTDPALWRKISDQLKRVKGGNRENGGEDEEICEQETMFA